MTNKKSTKSALFTSSISLLLCFAMLLGTTFAWFTDSVTSAGNIIKSGNLDVEMHYADGTSDPESATWEDASEGAIFKYELWEPGYVDVKHIEIANKGSLALKYQIAIVANGEVSKLSDVIDVYYADPAVQVENRTDLSDSNKIGTLTEVLTAMPDTAYGELLAGEKHTITLALKMQESAGNEYQNLSIGTDFSVILAATQLASEDDSFGKDYDKDATYPEIEAKAWDGTADTSWYNDTDTEFAIKTAEEVAGFAALVDAGNTFEGKTVKLSSNINLYSEDENGDPICFDPIGSYRKDVAFKGTFDGQGHTIQNMSQNTWALDNGYYYDDLGLGLFGAVENATIKNLVMDNASISGESALCGTIAAVAGDNVTFENIKVTNTEVADYQYYAGGIVGWAGGDEQFINCVIDASTTIGAQWGEFNNANGGVIGGVSTDADILIKDCTVACRIDAYNDVTSAYEWYAYRRSGMLIGDSGQKDDPDGDNVGNAIAPNLTCENVTVIYGDWANYHYCEFRTMSYPWVRVEVGTSNSAYSNPRYGHPTDANGNKVVDENHVHNDGEKHNELIVFDQLYGGTAGDRYCTYGTATHDGVTVVYNNK